MGVKKENKPDYAQLSLKIDKELSDKVENFWRSHLYQDKTSFVREALAFYVDAIKCEKCGAVNPKGASHCAICGSDIGDYLKCREEAKSLFEKIMEKIREIKKDHQFVKNIYLSIFESDTAKEYLDEDTIRLEEFIRMRLDANEGLLSSLDEKYVKKDMDCGPFLIKTDMIGEKTPLIKMYIDKGSNIRNKLTYAYNILFLQDVKSTDAQNLSQLKKVINSLYSCESEVDYLILENYQLGGFFDSIIKKVQNKNKDSD